MKRIIIGCMLAAATAIPGLMAQKQPQPKSKGEVEAIQAMFNAKDPDARIQAAEALITKFRDTEFKSIALFFETVSYEQKGDFEKLVVYGERTLEADPKNYQTMLMLGRNIALRTREFDLDREEKLVKAEKYATNAQEVLKDAVKPNPQVTDEQWAAAKKDMLAQAHEVFGMTAMARKKYDVAVNEFKAAVDGASQPDLPTMVRLATAYNQSGKYDDAIAILDKVMAETDVHPSVKQFAQAEKVRATQAKSGGAKPATSTAPAQVQIKQ